ncbi:uncharacterized protein LOC110445867 [Mizuhopecten yessoensis]|uniref:uncharacterized protein LOC110445867 n=1 Tax=Mizuhopecten yessoensis TaxID=6573 RepID=UPI000B45956E|nr:uncharacterized protein LOC110445867 [Mizuhopecten yessoensis]
MKGTNIFLEGLTTFLLLLITHPSGQTAVVVGLDLPVQISVQERLEPLELEPLELPEVPEVQETQEQPEAIEPLEPLEPLEIEPPEDPCSCAIRCCANPFELMRSTLLLNFHLPEVTSLSCCGCTSCPAGYFIVPVSRPFALSMMTSMASLRTPG